MSEGRSLKVQDGWIEKYFQIDSNGALFPRKDALRTKEAAQRIGEQVSKDRNLGRDMIRKIFSTDVEFAFRPSGSFPVIASGIPLFGPTPLRRLSFKGKIGAVDTANRESREFLKKCESRAKKERQFVQDAVATVESLEATTPAEVALKEVELDQAYTGGGYDNTEMFSITKSLLDFLLKCSDNIGEPDGPESKLLMSEITKFAERFGPSIGVSRGSLHFTSFMYVRLMQESDGMIGYPVFAKSSKTLTKDLALRVSMWSGVDCRSLVGATVKGISEQGTIERTAQVVDAMCFALDHMIASPNEDTFDALIWTLARIQRHGYKKGDDGDLVIKPGKARSVSPNAAFSGAQEAMSFDPFIKAMKDGKCPWMPSLQDRETADDLIWKWYENTLVPKEMRALPADWSGYDKTVKGWILATILYYIIRPLYDFDSQRWVDLAIVSLVFKYFFVSKTAAEAWPEMWSEVRQKYADQMADINDDFVLVATYNGLGSGAKLTHVGGSLYGELVIHHCIPAMLGYEGVDGPQAGDDTSLAVPISLINLSSKEKTYQPIADAAAKWGLEMNASKQMWVVGGDEVVNIFLQYSYNYNLQIRGVGTAVRYYVAYPFAEREKFLSIGEQYMAILSKFNNGVSNPWIRVWIRKWLEQDNYICAIFKEYGERAFDILIDSIGSSLKEVSERLELTYNWGLTAEQLEARSVPVIPVVVEVAQSVECSTTAAEAISKLQLINETEASRKGGDDVIISLTTSEAYGDDEDDDTPIEE